MSLAQRLASVQANRSNAGCVTCKWLDTLTPADRRAWDEWIADGNSGQQLWEVSCAEGLTISLTAFRHHMSHHRVLDES